MPTLYTHYTFGNDVLENVKKDLQAEIKKEKLYYNMFNQAFDNLYYYPFRWQYYRDFGIRCHKKKIVDFFRNAISYIKENNLQNDSSCTNMIYGIINHYILDTIVHPYINYQVENLKIAHSKIEFIYDAHLFKRRGNGKWHNKIYKELIPKLKFNDHLINLLDATFLKTYNEDKIGHIFNKSHNTGYYIYRYFINDYYGIKKWFYKMVDVLTFKKDFNLSETTFNIREFNVDILNNKEDAWHHPDDQKKIYHYSLDYMYEKSLKLAIKINNLAYDVIMDNANIDPLLDEIKKISLDNI